jgi:hypothetical protein
MGFITRLTISAPERVTVGSVFTVSGRLEFQDWDGLWKPLGNQTIKLFLNSTLIGSISTDGNGNYTMNLSVSKPGTFTLNAVYEGTRPPTEQLTVTVTFIRRIFEDATAFADLYRLTFPSTNLEKFQDPSTGRIILPPGWTVKLKPSGIGYGNNALTWGEFGNVWHIYVARYWDKITQQELGTVFKGTNTIEIFDAPHPSLIATGSFWVDR